MLKTIGFWLEAGGPVAWTIVLTGILLLVTSYERFRYLFVKCSYRSEEALGMVRAAVMKRDYARAMQICDTVPNAPDLSVVKSGLLAVEHGREAMRSALGASALEVARSCEKRVSIISLIAGVATLLGLLGTISGLIKTFAALAAADASQKAQMLGNGISEAMYSTAAGLLVGIVAMVVHTLCTSKSDEIVGGAQSAGYKLVAWIEESERSTGEERRVANG